MQPEPACLRSAARTIGTSRIIGTIISNKLAAPSMAPENLSAAAPPMAAKNSAAQKIGPRPVFGPARSSLIAARGPISSTA